MILNKIYFYEERNFVWRIQRRMQFLAVTSFDDSSKERNASIV